MSRQSVGESSEVPRILRQEDGFSAVELIIAMGVFLIVMGTVYLAFTGSLGLFSNRTDAVEQQGQARLSLNRAAREVRSAYSAITADANGFKFRMLTAAYSDATPDQSGIIKTMTVTYNLVPSGSYYMLRRTEEHPISGTASRFVGEYLRNANTQSGTIGGTDDLFHFYTSTDVELVRPVASTSAIERVRLTVIVDKDTAEPPQEILETTDIFMRSSDFR